MVVDVRDAEIQVAVASRDKAEIEAKNDPVNKEKADAFASSIENLQHVVGARVERQAVERRATSQRWRAIVNTTGVSNQLLKAREAQLRDSDRRRVRRWRVEVAPKPASVEQRAAESLKRKLEDGESPPKIPRLELTEKEVRALRRSATKHTTTQSIHESS